MQTTDIADVAGKNVIITGAALGIGFGVAERLSAAGANCLLVDRNSDALQAAAERLGTEHVYEADLALPEAPELICQAALSAFGSIDVLVNNAGIFPTQLALDMTPEFFRHVLDVNLVGLVFLSTAVGRHFRDQGTGGKIINIASIDSVHPSMAGLAAYDSSKGAVLMFTKNFALEMATYGVQVNAIAPGAIATEGASAPMAGLSTEQQQQLMAAFVNRIPLARMGQPDDIAKVVQFLAGPGSDYITGTLLPVDGGRLLG